MIFFYHRIIRVLILSASCLSTSHSATQFIVKCNTGWHWQLLKILTFQLKHKSQIECAQNYITTLLDFCFKNHVNKSLGSLEYWWHSFLQESMHNTIKVYTHFYTYYLPTWWGAFAHLGNTPYIRRCLQVLNFHHWQRRDVQKWVSLLSVLKVFCKIIQNLLFWHEKRRPVSYNRKCRIQTLNAMDSQCP